jgi:hypothetical protein
MKFSKLRPEVQARVKAQLAATRARRPAGEAGKDVLVSRRVTRGIARSQKLAEEFILRCRLRGLPAPVAEHRFADDRKWRFDLAWPDRLVAVEIDGGAFLQGGGGHNRGAAIRRDQEKLNEAAARGWLVLRFFPERLLGPTAFELVKRALKQREP